MFPSEYRDIISTIESSVSYDISSAAVDVSGGAVPLLLPMGLMIFHIKRKTVEDKEARTRSTWYELRWNCQNNLG